MNKFNKKSRNNVKEKQKQKRDSHRDRIAARNAAITANTGEVVLPKGKAERLAVSGKRTGKFKRKVLRKWSKASAAVAAMETGEVTMEDIVKFASQTSLRDKERSSTAQQSEGMEVQQKSAKSGGQVFGFRVKPSKKARLQLKRRGMAVESSSGAADSMME